MKSLFTLLLVVIFSFNNLHGQQHSDKEILIIGTSHTVPKIIKNSYKKILRRSKTYAPDIIFMESPVPTDDASWEYLKEGWSKGYQQFYRKTDSMRKSYQFDQDAHDAIMAKTFQELSTENIKTLINNFQYLRDVGNHKFYSYILKYGIEGSKKPTRHEDGDVTFKLALYMGHRYIQSMDYQAMNGLYHDAWDQCAIDGRTNGDNAINRKLNKQDYNRAIVPAIFGRASYPCSRKKFCVHNTYGIASSAPTNSASVLLFVLIFCFVLTFIADPSPIDIDIPVCER